MSFAPVQPLGDVAPPNFSLPIYSTQLGRLPVYGQFNFLDTIVPSHQETTSHIQMTYPPSSDSLFPGNFSSQQQLLYEQQDAALQAQLYPHLHDATMFPGLAELSIRLQPISYIYF
jgi:hypothetical protein